jgi:hypothetical protein
MPEIEGVWIICAMAEVYDGGDHRVDVERVARLFRVTNQLFEQNFRLFAGLTVIIAFYQVEIGSKVVPVTDPFHQFQYFSRSKEWADTQITAGRHSSLSIFDRYCCI